MTIETHDPRLTLYLHNEMDAAEKTAFESELAESPDAQAELDGLREMSELLENELAEPPADVLTDGRRARVCEEAKGDVEMKKPALRFVRPLITAAAVIAVAALVLPFLTPKVHVDPNGLAKKPTGPTPEQIEQTKNRKEFLADLIKDMPKEEERDERVKLNRSVKRKVMSSPKPSVSMKKSVSSYGGAPVSPTAGHTMSWLATSLETPVHNTESYSSIVENGFRTVNDHPLSTFSIDVDTASYANMRRFLTGNALPPKDAVRIEELINYFDYSYPQPRGDHPFSVNLEMSECPWNDAHKLVRIGLKGKEIAKDERANTNLVFLLDVSGSMGSANKLPLLKKAMTLLINELNENDRVAIAVYAGAAGLVLPSTSADQKDTIINAFDTLGSGGSTNGGAGIKLAYKTAVENFIEGGVNRVILATDGDFNVGVSNNGDLTRLIEKGAGSGVYLSILGFGMGNYKDDRMEELSNKGNGNYAYIDTIKEAEKVLVREMSGTLVTIAKDVKIQIEFNPASVAGYRLIGYENRMLKKEDFNNDKKDAGDIGAGHTVTALYEIVPAGVTVPAANVDALKYQTPRFTTSDFEGELMTVKLRYKQPDGQKSTLITTPLEGAGKTLENASSDFRFAAAVAQFGMLIRDSEHKGSGNFETVKTLAKSGLSNDRYGYRKEFIELVNTAARLKAVN